MATAFLPTIDDTRPRPRRPGDLPAIVAVQDPVVADTAVQGDLPVVAAPVDHPIDQDQTQGKVALPVIPATTAPVATPVATSGAEDDPVTHYGGAMAYKVQTTAAAVNPTWTVGGSGALAANINSFKHS